MLQYICPLCGNSNTVEHYNDQTQQYRLCLICDLIFVPKPFHISSDHERNIYLLHENSIENQGYVDMFRRFLNEVLPICDLDTNKTKVLDFGCGYEPVLQKILQKDGYTCDIYDAYFFSQVPLVKYDLIVSTEVFEHFSNPAKEVELILSLLNSEGFVGVMTKQPLPSLDFSSWYYKKDETHICFYSPKCFEWIAKKYNLNLIYNNNDNIVVFSKK